MKTSDVALGLIVVLCGAAAGGWIVHSMPWYGLLLGVSLGLPFAMFIVFIRILSRAGPCPLSLRVRDITGEPDEEGEASTTQACNSIRSLSQGL